MFSRKKKPNNYFTCLKPMALCVNSQNEFDNIKNYSHLGGIILYVVYGLNRRARYLFSTAVCH